MRILAQSLILAGLLFGTTASGEPSEFDVLKSMSAAQFRSTGLDKLSDAQLKALNAWFNQYLQQQGPACGGAPVAAPATPAAAPATAAPAISPASAAGSSVAPGSITAHIVGDFTGWHGGTRFTLDNGQVWEQVDDSIVTVGHVTNPKVTISHGLFNSYYMSVEGISDTVQVKRIK